MSHESVIDAIGNTPLVQLSRLFDGEQRCVSAKLEMLNPGGSIKDRTAKYMIARGLSEGRLERKSHLIESSSGNLGISLAIVAKHYGIRLTCVVDPKICASNLRAPNKSVGVV